MGIKIPSLKQSTNGNNGEIVANNKKASAKEAFLFVGARVCQPASPGLPVTLSNLGVFNLPIRTRSCVRI